MKKETIYKNRARTKDDNYQSHPLQITYEEPVFKKGTAIQALVSLFREKPRYTLTVSRQRPYLEAALLDRRDGSSYDIWVTEVDVITIIPQLRATEESLKTLVEHIQQHFKAGEVKEE